MKLRTIAAILTIALPVTMSGPVFAASDIQAKPLHRMLSLGGEARTPVKSGDIVYVASGATITAWDYSKPQAPVSADTRKDPAQGVIAGIALKDGYLYAGWNRDIAGGIAIYSLAKPGQPKLIKEISNVGGADFRFINSIAVVDNYLYVFDENGVHVNRIDHPTALTRVGSIAGSSSAFPQTVSLQGNRLMTTGRSYLGATVLAIYDVSKPAHPALISSTGFDGINNFKLQLGQWPRAVGFGAEVSSYGLKDTNSEPEFFGSQAIRPVAYQGFVAGQFGYSLSAAGIGAWDVSAVPRHAGNTPFNDAFAAYATYVDGQQAWVSTGTDRLANISVQQPNAPQILSNVTMPGSHAPSGAALIGDKLAILQANYGATVVNRKNFTPLARFDASLPQENVSRGFTDWSVNGPLAYMLSWGSGLVVTDFSKPQQPVELSKFPAANYSAISVQGGYAYLGRTTNGGNLAVIDVSQPTQPKAVSSIDLDSGVLRLQQRGNLLFAATGTSLSDTNGGLRIFNVKNPAAPVLEGSYTSNDCRNGSDLAVSNDGKRVYLRCETGLHIVDTSSAVAPKRLGFYAASASSPSSLTSMPGRVFMDDNYHLVEIDVRDPAKPVKVSRHAMPTSVSRLEIVDGRLFAFTGTGGMQVFRFGKNDARDD